MWTKADCRALDIAALNCSCVANTVSELMTRLVIVRRFSDHGWQDFGGYKE